jgi:hypothetical protein
MVTQNSDNIAQYFPPHRIIGFLEVYEELMYYLSVLPFFSKYLMNTRNLIIDFFTPKFTLIILKNFMFIWTWEKDNFAILDEVHKNDIPQ